MLLILGAGGQVGRALAARAGVGARGLDRAACDVTDRAAVAHALSAPGLSAVVNCAAYTAVDRAESERERVFAVNAEGAGIVARAAASRGLPVIQLSTDYVYGGSGAEPHREDEAVAPLNVYGLAKAAGDAAVGTENPAHLILRVSWVFGVHGANFVKTMLRLGRVRSELRIVDDQRGGPTEARDIADAILAMAARCGQPDFADWGIYHFAGAPSTSWHGFAQTIFDCAGRPVPRLVAISSRDYPTPAGRPMNSLLDCGRIRRRFGLDQPDWRISLSRVVADLLRAGMA
jgi:dTDP-4-dehydrorhamnose reductase